MADDEITFVSRGAFLFRPDLNDLYLRIPVEAAGANMDKAKFKLTSDEPKYDKTKTGEDDLFPGDEYAELLFEDCSSKGKFSLEIDPGNGKPKFLLFKDKPYSELAGITPDQTTGSSEGGDAGA